MIKVMVSIASYQRRRPEQGMGPLRHGLLSRPIQLRDVNFDGCGGWVQKYFAPGHNCVTALLYIETADECPSFGCKSGHLQNHPLDRYATLGFFLRFRATVPLLKFRGDHICSF